MPKRPNDKYNTVLVKFYVDVADKDAHSFLAWLGVSGSRVSTLIRRWAVEVPYWREDEFINKFYASELVQAVHGSFDKNEDASQEAPTDEQAE